MKLRNRKVVFFGSSVSMCNLILSPVNDKAIKLITSELIAQRIVKHCIKWQLNVCNEITHFGGGCAIGKLKSISNKRKYFLAAQE